MITVDLAGDGVISEMDESFLDGPFIRIIDDDREYTVITAYVLDSRVVHRSPHVTLKQGIGIEAALGVIGG